MYRRKYFIKIICREFIFDNSNFDNVSLNILSSRIFQVNSFESSLVAVIKNIVVLETIFDLNY